jgi:hypothetical protein
MAWYTIWIILNGIFQIGQIFFGFGKFGNISFEFGKFDNIFLRVWQMEKIFFWDLANLAIFFLHFGKFDKI